MPAKIYDVAIIGLGAMGSATLMGLAKRGVRVCGIEQFHTSHSRGSSHGQTRIIRKAYFEHPDYMPLLDLAYDAWQTIERDTVENLMTATGLIAAGQPDSDCITGLEACYKKYALPHTKMSASESRRYFPQFSFPDDYVVYHDPMAGYLRPEKCIEAMIRIAVRLGAHPFIHETVKSWTQQSSHLKIETDRREILAEKLIITTGAWAVDSLKPLGINLEIWRKPVFWYSSSHIQDYLSPGFPIFFVESDTGSFYGFPAIDELGLKVASHSREEVTLHPDKIDRSLKSNDEAHILQFVDRILPDFMPQRTHFSVCMYSMTADGHFILDLHPENGNVVFGAGFSGHGFKFAPVVGEVLADLALNGATDLPIALHRIDRLRNGVSS